MAAGEVPPRLRALRHGLLPTSSTRRPCSRWRRFNSTDPFSARQLGLQRRFSSRRWSACSVTPQRAASIKKGTTHEGTDVGRADEPADDRWFPYKRSTGEVTGRFLAGLKEQKKIWGRRIAGQGVVVPPNSYSEIDAKTGGEWGRGEGPGHRDRRRRGRLVAGRRPAPERPSFAYVLVKLDGADRRWRTSSGPSRRAEGRLARQGRVGGRRRAQGEPSATSPASSWVKEPAMNEPPKERIKFIQTDLYATVPLLRGRL